MHRGARHQHQYSVDAQMQPVREALGYILLEDELDGVLCRFDQLKEPPGVLQCGGAGSEEFSKVRGIF